MFCDEGGPYFGVQVSILSCIASCASLNLLIETGKLFRRYIVLRVADRLLQHFIRSLLRRSKGLWVYDVQRM